MFIPLYDNQRNVVATAIVDPDDFDKIAEYSWHLNKKDGYAYTSIDGYCKSMHQLVVNNESIDAGTVIDHINHEKLDNRKCNLRVVSSSFNNHNKKSDKKFKGTSFCHGKFKTQITLKGKTLSLGFFQNEEDAAKEYDKASILIYGKDAHNNKLLTENEIQDLINKFENIDAFLDSKKIQKNDGLPKGVFPSGTLFYVSFKGQKYKGFTSAESAGKYYEDLVKEDIRRKEDERKSLPILRNDAGQAVIPLRDVKGVIQDYAIVDDNRWHELMAYSWSRVVKKLYVIARINTKLTYMHHYVYGKEVRKGMVIDHINGNHKDNRLQNLREVTYGQNNQNKKTNNGGKSSNYHGVTWAKDRNKWHAQIAKDGKHYHLGHFLTEQDAAKAYDIKANELYENPLLNFP